MPELPDLQYIVKKLRPALAGRRIEDVEVKEPIVIRMLRPGSFGETLRGRAFTSVSRRGPFLRFDMEGVDLILHPMLAGRLHLGSPQDRRLPHLAFTLRLDNGTCLRYLDDKKMGKVYVAEPGSYDGIPGYREQGVDITSDAFSRQAFEGLLRGRRQQARVFLMDQAALSAIGNAYADEILFSAGIHPKTPCNRLSAEERGRLYDSVRSVMSWGIAEVEKAGQPIDVKVRGHMRVRNRKDEPCPVCGATIRRTGVLGYDSFFCPRCQPASRKQAIPW
jgi:formamidopyrimidine-DNA glycosylase